MNLRDLQYLAAVADLRHFGKAAEACFVSQPTLSTQIKKLEEELGVTLIERNNKHVLLTDIGQQIVSKARDVLRSVKEMHELSSQHNDPEAGTFRLGVIPTLAPYLLPQTMPSIQARFPKLRFFLYELQTAVILQKLPTGELDAALLALPVEHSSLDTIPLFSEPFYAAVPEQHPLANRSNVRLEDLGDDDVLLLEDGHCLRDQTLDLCRRIGTHETDGFRATSLETLRQMVAAGNGVTFMPALAIGHGMHDTQRVHYLPFRKSPPSRSIALTFRRSSHRERLIHDIGELIRQCVDKLLPSSNID